MNENLRQLAISAQIEHCVSYVRLEEFAELIVKKCAELLWTEECYNSDLALEEFEKNSKKIKEHFGLKDD